MRRAFKISYWGGGFHGYGRQPGLRTVEGTLLDILQSRKIIEGPHRARFESASRTDKGVSALANVVAFHTAIDPRKVAALVNSSAENIWLHAYAAVPDTFRPRHARERWYRYYFHDSLHSHDVEIASRLFLGEHDFRSFSKGRAPGICDIRECTLHSVGDLWILDVRADRFLRNMVRRVAGCLLLVTRGELAPDDVARALDGEVLRVSPAPPEGLWLMDVSYEFPFRSISSKALEKRLQAIQRETGLREKFTEELRRRLEKR